MTAITEHQELSGALLSALASELRKRTPRAGARDEIDVQSVPMRTCYQTMMRLSGPSNAVLDYAAYLFAEEAAAPSRPTPPLTLEEAQVEAATGTVTLVLSRGAFTTAR